MILSPQNVIFTNLTTTIIRKRTYADIEISDISVADYIAHKVKTKRCWLPVVLTVDKMETHSLQSWAFYRPHC